MHRPYRSLFSTLLVLSLSIGFLICEAGPIWGGEKESEYTDKAGEEALRLWAERERDRAVADAARRYWDYWLYHPSRRYSTHRLWLNLEQIQRWLKDPDHNPPPPPPPLPQHWMPPYYPPAPYLYSYSYPYSYPYYYAYPPPCPPSPYFADPFGWPPPYYRHPALPGGSEDFRYYRSSPEKAFEKGD